MTEPMSRESVLAVLADGAAGLMIEGRTNCAKDLRQARATVAALYDERDALIASSREIGYNLLERGIKLPRAMRLRASALLEPYVTGTEASDAEGGG